MDKTQEEFRGIDGSLIVAAGRTARPPLGWGPARSAWGGKAL